MDKKNDHRHCESNVCISWMKKMRASIWQKKIVADEYDDDNFWNA